VPYNDRCGVKVAGSGARQGRPHGGAGTGV